jgi:MFS family permease
MERLADRFRAPLTALRGIARSPDLRRIQLAYTGSEVGSWIAMIGMSLLAFDAGGLTGFGVAFGLRMLPPTIAAPFMGVVADRFSRRRVMVTADLARMGLMAVAAAVVFLGGPVWVVYVTLSVVSVASTAFRPAQAALLPALAQTPDELTAANAVSSTIEGVTSFAGPAIGGVLVAATSPGAAFVVTSGTFLWSAFLVRGVREPAGGSVDEPAAEGERAAAGIVAELTAGARTLVSDGRVALLVGLMAAQVVVSGALLVFLAGVAFDTLGGGEEQLGALLSALGIGGVLGAFVSLGIAGGKLVRSFAVGVALWGVPIALLAAWQSEVGAYVLVAVIGLANTVVDVAAFTLLQRAIPDDVLARVFGILESVMYGMTVAGALIAPALVAWVGLDAALVLTGLFLPVLVVLTWRGLAGLDLHKPAESRLELLRAVPFLAPLPATALEHLAGSLRSHSFAGGQTVFRQGDAGDQFYVVEGGEVAVAADGRQIYRGGPGYYFGEIALVRDEPRMATVTATTEATVLALAREEFLGAVTGHTESAKAADAVIASRLRASRPGLLDL